MNKQANVTEFRRLEAEIAKTEADVEAKKADVEAKKWRQAELAAEAVADGMTRAQYADEVKKAATTIGRFVIVWERWGGLRHAERPRFADAYDTVDRGSDEILTASERGKLSRERQMPTRHEDRVEMVTKLMADPVVAKTVAATVTDPKTKAGRLISQQVHEHEAEQRQRRAERARQKALDEALPLPAYMADMVVKINEWSLGLAALVDDLDGLPEGRGRELVAEAVRGLNEQTQRWLDKLEPRPELHVIEGRSRAIAS